jgi:hypothetical protein
MSFRYEINLFIYMAQTVDHAMPFTKCFFGMRLTVKRNKIPTVWVITPFRELSGNA